MTGVWIAIIALASMLALLFVTIWALMNRLEEIDEWIIKKAKEEDDGR